MSREEGGVDVGNGWTYFPKSYANDWWDYYQHEYYGDVRQSGGMYSSTKVDGEWKTAQDAMKTVEEAHVEYFMEIVKNADRRSGKSSSMKVTVADLSDCKSLIGGLVLSTMNETAKELYKKRKTDEGEGYLSARILVEDEEVDARDFLERWQKSVEEAVQEEARKRVSNVLYEKVGDAHNMIEKIRKMLEEVVEKIVEET